MPELRKDPIVGRWVIIATERTKRPLDFGAARPEPRRGLCPFCPGQESMTPPELFAVRPPDGPGARPNAPGWKLRAFPNKFPALRVEGDLDKSGDGIYDRMNGVGAHEVIVETPDHNRRLCDLPEADIAQLFFAYRERMIDLERDRRMKYVMIFKNHGKAAGASLDHPHTQLIALPVVPRVVSEEMKGARKYHRLKERCVFCDIARQELKERERLVYENKEFVVIEPYAPKFPFETWVMPRSHRPRFESCSQEDFMHLANACKVALQKLNVALDDPPYNFILHTTPFHDGEPPHYHWHLEIMPTLIQVAGFEWGSGFYINPTPPEEAAKHLREIEV
jgi:UDPglucose--hexose-1-phosphate uridylyltransferase